MKAKLPLPVYYDESYGPPHALQWQSYVVVQELKFCCESFYASKVAAQQDAARVACDFFTLQEPPSKSVSITPQTLALDVADYIQPYTQNPNELKEVYIHVPPEWTILVDVENLQPSITHGKPVEYYVFMSEFSSIDPEKYTSVVSKVIRVDSSNSDAADHLMSYYAGQLTKTSSCKKYIILSRDKASATLATLLATDGFEVKHFKDVPSFQKFIDSL